MHVELERVAAVAEIDAERDRLIREIRDRRAAIEQAAQADAEARAIRDRAYLTLEGAQAAERAANARVTEHRHRHSQAAKALDLQSSGSEALERQLQQTAALADRAETEVLEAMELQDRYRTEVADAERAAVLVAATKTEVDARVPREIAGLEGLLAAADLRRVPAIAAMSRELAERYELLYRKKRTAVATVVNGTCNQCQRTVPVQQVSDLKRGITTEACRGCGRWLIPAK